MNASPYPVAPIADVDALWWRMRPSAWQRYGRHIVLFLLTVASVVLTGALYGSLDEGVRLALGVIPILFAHEMGHYVACRYHKVDATLPFFIPSPWLPLQGLMAPWIPLNTLVGTFGAVIRIKSPFPNRKALFDIGIAGPLAGFVVLLPVLYFGIQEAVFVPAATLAGADGGLPYGSPLLIRWAFQLLRSAPPDSVTFVGPIWTGAWFGLLVTALNLMPIGQLDGGHVTYALFGRRAFSISRAAWWVAIALIAFFGPGFILWVALIRILGFRHPRTLDDEAPVGKTRALVALIGLAVFVVSFVPQPIVFGWSDTARAFADLFQYLRGLLP